MERMGKLPAFQKKPFQVLLSSMEWIMRVCAILLVIYVTYYVIVRYLFGMNVLGFEEICTLLALWLYFIGGAYASMEKSHISADMMPLFIHNQRHLDWVHLVRDIIAFATLIFLFYLCFDFFTFNLQFPGKTTQLSIPKTLYDLALLLGFALMIVFDVFHLIYDVRVLLSNNCQLKSNTLDQNEILQAGEEE